MISQFHDFFVIKFMAGFFPFGPARARDSSGPVLIGRLIRSLILALFKQISTDRDMCTLYDIAENSP